MTPFDKESLLQDERKVVSEFSSSGALTFKNLAIDKLIPFCFCDKKGGLHKEKAKVEPKSQPEVTGEDGMELWIWHGLPRVQHQAPLTFIFYFNYNFYFNGPIGYLFYNLEN